MHDVDGLGPPLAGHINSAMLLMQSHMRLEIADVKKHMHTLASRCILLQSSLSGS